jgi:ribosome-associated translation inhibitor RaiA
MTDVSELYISTSVRGAAPPTAKEYAEVKIRQLVGRTRDPILFGQIRLILEPDPALERPAIAEATLDVNGQPVRAHVAAGELLEAIDLLEERLERRLARHAARVHHEGRDRAWSGMPGEHEWRHGDVPTARPEFFDRPLDEREVIRHKSFADGPMTLDEAAFDLDLLGHDFYLFTELTTGADSVLFYENGSELGLIQAEGASGDPLERVAAPVAVHPPAPSLEQRAAVERLEDGGEPFVCFSDAATGRGSVLYHRYDGHYGLITLAEPVPTEE